MNERETRALAGEVGAALRTAGWLCATAESCTGGLLAGGVLAAVPRAHLALSTTGIAGPDGATPGKPVGMVCFGIARRAGAGIVTRAITQVFEGDREAVRDAAVRRALQAALAELGKD